MIKLPYFRYVIHFYSIKLVHLVNRRYEINYTDYLNEYSNYENNLNFP